MATPFPFTLGQTLTAAQMNAITTLPINDQIASYTALVGDVGKRIVMNVATANTVTINNSVFAAGDTIFIANKGAGATTVTAGAGVTINTSGSLVIAAHGGGNLVALSASVFAFFSGGAPVNTISVQYLLIAGGGGGGSAGAARPVGGAGAGGYICTVSGENTGGGLAAGQPAVLSLSTNIAVVIGAGGAAVAGNNPGLPGNSSTLDRTSAFGGGFGPSTSAKGGDGGSGGGTGDNNNGTGQNAPGFGNVVAIGQGFKGAGPTTSGASTTPGGGGGAGGAGSLSFTVGAGVGLASSITGSSVTRAVGGNAAGNAAGGTNLGTGGAGATPDGTGGAGGSGVLIMKYADTFTCTIGAGLTGSTASPSGGFKVTSITAGSGNVSFA